MSDQIPKATVTQKPNAKVSAAWFIPLLATVIAFLLLLQWLHERGPVVTITFDNANGLTKDAPVMYRGAVIGRVEHVQLNGDASKVIVEARLHATAQDVARVGTTWWIVHPEISLEGVAGLDTIISPRYLTLSVGNGELAHVFTGSASQTISGEKAEGTNFTLVASSVHGITVGTPLFYRGLEVGDVRTIQFAPNATSVLIDIVVQQDYVNLIRLNTKFWSVSGVDFDLGWSGASLDIGPVSSLLKGGIQLATPDTPEDKAPAGFGFPLEIESEEDWLEWEPQLPLKRDLDLQ
ncbi:MAG: MlaD family protein [Phycisphaerales bacterium]|jgi:paraquat-inducible protein B|nr:MlaD family protein [Phycisphaerales bacterium]